MKRSFHLIPLAVLLLYSCVTLNRIVKSKHSNCQALTQDAIFQFIHAQRTQFDQATYNGPIKLDPVIADRRTLIIRDSVYFQTALLPAALSQPSSHQSFRLVIPDSLSNDYIYCENGLNPALDYGMIFQFSPMQPSIHPNIFLMQYYVWENTCGDPSNKNDTICCRSVTRGYLELNIENQKIKHVKYYNPSSDDAYEFKGLYCFSRNKIRKK